MQRRSCTRPLAENLAGIGLRSPHEQEIIEQRPEIGWLEVHSENYFGAGGRPQTQLRALAAHYPISLHGIGLGLGNQTPPSQAHCQLLRRLCELVQPCLISDHLCWNGHGGRFVPDLLPLMRTEKEARRVATHIDQVQQIIGRGILIENVSSYVELEGSRMPEWEFLLRVAELSDCGILLDVNNIFVNATNHGFDPYTYLDAIPGEYIGEIHLAGHSRREVHGQPFLIDTHDRPVSEPVWTLYRDLIRRVGPKPTLIERDARLPPLRDLLAEAGRAQQLLDETMALA